jgi:uncharacterized phage-associated protein
MNVFFCPSIKKVIQAASVLLENVPEHRMSYLRLLKLLYIADRESLKRGNRPVLGTRPVAMKNGPLHSDVFNLIKKEHIDEALWSEFIQKERYEVKLIRDPGVSELSRFEIGLLNEIADKYCGVDDFDLVEITHTFPEWQENYPDPSENTSRVIRLEDMIRAVGIDSESESEILADAKEDCEFSRLQGGCSRR